MELCHNCFGKLSEGRIVVREVLEMSGYMGRLKKFGKVAVSLVAGITVPLLGLIGIRRNYKVARDTYTLNVNRMACDQGWWDGLHKPRYGVTMQYVAITTLGALAVSGMGISEAAIGGNGGPTIFITALYSCVSAAMVCLSPDMFRSWLNDINRYFLCGRSKNWKDYFGNTRLHQAIYRQDIAEVQVALTSEPDLTIQNEKNENINEPSTALVLANECINKKHMDEILAARVYDLVSEAAKKNIVGCWETQTETTISLLYHYSGRHLSRDTALIVSDYCFDDHLPKQIELLVNRNPLLQETVQKEAIKLICFEIHQRKQLESQNKRRTPALAINVGVNDEEIIPIVSRSDGYVAL